MDFSKKNIEISILLAVIAIVAIWQFIFVIQLPDGDTDAYAHFIIARDIARNPYNLSLHWVWLPLFHYIGAFFVLAGSEMQSVRVLNVIVWNSIPLLLYYNLKKKDENSLVPISAALITALSPIGILMGTTAQPEPLFTFLVLLFIIKMEEGKYFYSAVVLSLACMLRYEAWAVLSGTGIYLFINIMKEKTFSLSVSGKSHKIYAVILLPALVIFIWSFLRYLSDGQWFLFLHGTQKFASDALAQDKSIEIGFLKFVKDLILYPFWIPFLFTGIIVLLIPFGFIKFYSKNKFMFVAGISILVFISISWVMKSNLGLKRHFTSIVPFYSVMIVYGLYSVNDYLKRFSLFRSGKLIPVIAAVLILSYTGMWLFIWRSNNEFTFKDKKEALICLNKLYTSDTKRNIMFVNNDPVLEVLSKIDYKVFNHFWMRENQETKEYLLSLKKSNQSVYVITNPKLLPYLINFGDIIYESDQDINNPDRIIVLKI